MSLYPSCLRPLLFRLDAEMAHHGTVEVCHWLGAVPGVQPDPFHMKRDGFTNVNAAVGSAQCDRDVPA